MRKVIIGLLCAGALAVIFDFGTAAYSEYRVSRSLRAGANLTGDPEVTFHGFPFLVQAFDGEYRNVQIRARAMRPDIPGEIMVEATLTGAHLPFGALADGSVRTVVVDDVTGRMRIEPTELGRLFDIPDLQVFSGAADKSDGSGGSGGSGMTTAGALILTGTIPLYPDLRIYPDPHTSGEKVSVKADLLLDDDRIRIVATDLYRGVEATPVSTVPVTDRATVLARFTRTIDTRNLPFGVQPTQVSARGGQIVVEGEGKYVTIDLDRMQQQP